MKVLVVDVGGTHIKILATGQEAHRQFDSGPSMTPQEMVAGVKAAAQGWDYDVISIGYPGPVMRGKMMLDPVHLGPGWIHFDFANGFGCPVKIVNDAAMQALGSYQGGRMLFLGLGTGLGSALILDGILAPMELGHLPYKKATFEDYVGVAGLDRFGKRKWRRYVFDIVARLIAALQAEYVILGGGNVKKLKELPPNARQGSNDNAFAGGFALWDEKSPVSAQIPADLPGGTQNPAG